MKTQAKFTYMLVVAFLLAATMLVVASAAQESTTLLDKYPLKYYHITVNKTLNGTDTVLYQISLENTLNPRNIADDYPDMTYFKDITLTYSVNDDTYINYNKIKAEYKAYTGETQNPATLDYKLYKPNKNDMCNMNAFIGGINFGIGLIPTLGNIYGVYGLGKDWYECKNAPKYRWLGERYIHQDKSSKFIENENIYPIIDYYGFVIGASEEERNNRRQDTLGVSANLMGRTYVSGVRFTIPLKINDADSKSKFRFLMDSSTTIGLYFEDNIISTSRPSINNTPPTIQAFNVTPLNLTIGKSFSINYTVSDSDGAGLKRVELWRMDNKSDWQQIKNNTLAGGNGPLSGSFTDSPSAPGKYWYGVHVVDNPSNWNDEKNSNTNGQPSSFEPVEVEVKTTDQTSISNPSTHPGLFKLNDSSYVCSVAFSPDGNKIAAASKDNTFIWNVANGEKLLELNTGDCSVAFSPDGSKIATGDGKDPCIWDVASGKMLLKLSYDKTGFVDSIAFSPDGSKIAMGSLGFADGALIFDAANGDLLLTVNDGYWDGDVRSVAFSPDGSKIATAGFEDTRIWDVASGKKLLELHPGGMSVAFSPDGSKIATGDGKDPCIWDAASGKKLFELHAGNYSYSVAFSPDGSKIATAGDGTRIWDVASGEMLRELRPGGGSVAFSPDGSKIATGSNGDVVRIWDVATGEEL